MRVRWTWIVLTGFLVGCAMRPLHGGESVDAAVPTNADSGVADGGDAGDGSAVCAEAGCLADAAIAVCGNYVLDPNEACDDGNPIDTDGCTNACRFPGCGDGVVVGPGPYEVTLDLLASAPDGPSSVALFWNDVLVATVAVTETSCRPAIVRATIPWSDVSAVLRSYRNVFRLEAPPDVLVTSAGLAILTSSFDAYVTLVDVARYAPAAPACLPSIRGPATFQPGWSLPLGLGFEDCDVGPTDSATCHHCVAAYCGDGLVEPELGEACDFAAIRSSTPCNLDCELARCGDGWLRYGDEECDDGNVVDGDGCDASCKFDRCGDGVINPSESCDDGNVVDTDACVRCRPALCGDGHVFAGVETCDDASASCFAIGCGVAR